MTQLERKYYPINENSARTAKVMNSFSDYKNGSATEIYKSYCDTVYDVLEKIKEQKPDEFEKASYKVDRYCYKLAEYYNAYYRNESYCPSIMISGGSNFPVRKKERQNSRRETLMNTWNYLQEYKKKIVDILTCEQAIQSNDKNAIEKLENKISQLEAEHKQKLEINKYWRKHGTMNGFENMSESDIEKINLQMSRCTWGGVPCIVCNDTANIRRYKKRLETLQNVKSSPVNEEIISNENEPFKVVENTEIMRLQLLFVDKPSEETRTILKKNGFKWSPSQQAWQRQLTENARYSLNRVKSALNI